MHAMFDSIIIGRWLKVYKETQCKIFISITFITHYSALLRVKPDHDDIIHRI